MLKITGLHKALLGAAIVSTGVLGSGGANAASCVATFDGAASGATANSLGSAANCGFTFTEGVLVADLDANGNPIVDQFGLPIPGPDSHWETDPTGSAIFVTNPTSIGRGSAPSPSNALNAVDRQVLMMLSAPLAHAQFSVTLDNSTFGDPLNYFMFLSDTGHVTQQSAFNQGGSGTVLTFFADNVAGILLPSNKLYDNISVSAVPLPAALPLLFSGLGLFGAFGRRRARLTAA